MKDTLHTKSPFISTLACVAILASSFMAISTPLTADAQREEVIVDRIVARVNNEIVTQSQVARFLPIYIQVMGPRNPQQLQTASGREQIARDLIQFLIDAELLKAKAADAGMQMSDSDIEAYLENYRSQLDMSEDQFRAALQREGINFEDYKDFMGKYLLRMQVMRAEGISDISIADEAVEEEFEARYPDGLEETYVRTSHIFLKLEANASEEETQQAYDRLMELRAAITSGEREFAAVASEVNDDSTANRGGQLTAFPVADLAESYSRAALALEQGGISEPVRTSRGLHLIRLDEVQKRATGNEERIRERIRYELRQTKAQQRQEAYLENLRDSAFTEVLVDDFNL
jgi:peptidyl-prolyl cis-trans isomerase SurA